MGWTMVKTAFGRFFEYDTPKIVHIRSLKVGIFYRLVQLLIITYVIGYAIVYKKGYQENDSVESAVTSKVKGVVLTNATDHGLGVDGVRIWDTADYVVPPQENGAFFVTTNVIISPNQEQGVCPEVLSQTLTNTSCSNDTDCPAWSHSANGVRNGTCYLTTKTCWIYAWCPVEIDDEPQIPVLQGTENFTVLIKNQIFFPKFKVRRRNIFDSFVANKSYLNSCNFDPVKDPYCPVFRLGDMIRLADENYTALAIKGAVMGFTIEWDCNLDYSEDYCRPVYAFRRIDNKDDTIAKGWNFRYANYWTDTVNGTSTERRTLVKAFGIRVIFYVYGKAGKFNVVPLAMNLGAGLALLGLSVVICDVIILYCSPKRRFYADNKYLQVKDTDAFLIEESQSSNRSYSYGDYGTGTAPA